VASKSDKGFSKKKKFNKKNQNPKNLNMQKKEFEKTGRCFNCDKQCHFTKTYKASKKKEKKDTHNVNFVAMFFQVTSPSDNSDWWLDTGATCHVCSNKDLLSTYIAAKENVSMVNCSTADVLGTGIVVLVLTSGKTLILKTVKYVPSIFKNLVSGSLLCDTGMRLDFQGEKVILSYKKIYFGNAYRTDGMACQDKYYCSHLSNQ